LRGEYLAPGKEREKQWLLKHAAELGGGYIALTAAYENSTDVALTCLRRWPEQAEDVVRECSLGVLRPGCLGQRLLDNRASGGPPQDVIAIHAISAAASAVQSRGALTIANVHICGEGYAGKSMTRQALLECFNSSFGLFLSSALPDIPSKEGRTLGMVCESLDRSVWLSELTTRMRIHDYGGQEAFRVNHASYLSAPNSVYLLVVPLWDMRPRTANKSQRVDEPMELEYIVEKYRDWLKFINSVVPESTGKVQCITVLNFARQFDALSAHKKTYTAENAITRLLEVQDVFCASSQCKVEFVAAPLTVNSNDATSVREHIVPQLWKAIDALQGAPVLVSPVVQAVVDDLLVPGRWPLFCEESELQTKLQATIRASLRLDPVLDSDPAVKDKVLSTVAEIAQDRLQARGDIIVFTTQNATKSSEKPAGSPQTSPRISINHPNWLSEQVLGDLFKPDTFTDGAGVRDILLTHDRITAVSLPAGASLTPSQRQLLPKLLQHIGACLPVTYADGAFRTVDTDTDTEDGTPPQHYFPAFNVTRMDATHALPWRDPVHVIVRMFKLKDPTTTVLPPGYFPALKVHIVSLYHGSNLIQLYHNGMALEMARGLRVIVRGGTDDTSFTLEVEAKADRSGECTVSAWEEMLKVRALVVKDAGWLKNVPLDEYGVHPERRQAIARPVSELDPLAQAGKLCPEDEPFYFGLGKADALASLRELVLTGFTRVERKLQQLRGESRETLRGLLLLHARSVTAQSDGDAGGGEPVTDVELDSLWSDAERAVRARNLEAGELRAPLAAECRQLVNDEVRAIQAELEGTQHRLEQLQTAVVTEHTLQEERRRRAEREQQVVAGELRVVQAALLEQDVRVDSLEMVVRTVETVQDNDHYSVYDVPFLAEVIPADGKGTWKDAVRRQLCDVVRMHFCCPACGLRAASGKNHHGYMISVPKGWVRTAVITLEVTLLALQVASLFTPLPLPRLAEIVQYLPLDTSASQVMLDVVAHLQEQTKDRATEPTAQQQVSDWLTAQRQLQAQTLKKIQSPQAGQVPSTVPQKPVITRNHVAAVRELLIQAKDKIPPEHSGLVFAEHAGSKECAWVCASCKDKFVQEGKKCLKIEMDFN
jgi:hypothetical protein